ncbi:MAG: hypothetical protein C0596_10685 [Marinilabiliales bacterium]|nr:MAG: hypothetical protein C0596_10685 [Marinilabiliales bacterium]
MHTRTKLPANIILYMGLFSLAVGITSIAIPESFLKTIIIAIGVMISVSGAVLLILRLKNKTEKKFIQVVGIVFSSLVIIAGLILSIFPTTFIDIFIIVLGVALIFGGLTQLIMSLNFQPLTTTAKVFLGFSLLMIIAGTVMALNPFEAAKGITVYFGIIMTIFGIVNIMMSFWIRTKVAKLIKAEKMFFRNISVIKIDPEK